jgi:hypothetical protein
MSKIKLLLDVVEDMRRLADSLQTIADNIEGNTDPATETPQSEEKTPQKHTAPAITIDQVRAVLADKSGEGKTAEVKALLYKYDAGKLSGVKPEDYAALLEEAKKL